MIRIASYNVENLFARAKALDLNDWELGAPILAAYREVTRSCRRRSTPRPVSNGCSSCSSSSISTTGTSRACSGGVRRRIRAGPGSGRTGATSIDSLRTGPRAWRSWPRVVRAGSAGWELAMEPVDEVATRMTARVIGDVHPDILCVVEAEDRPALVRFNEEMLGGRYAQVMLVDGNDDRGIDLGIMVAQGFEIRTIRSNVYARDSEGEIFSRDCPQYEVMTPSGQTLHLLLNHFKSQSGGGGPKRARQAAEVRRIVDGLVAASQNVVVLGDLNEGPATGTHAANLAALYDNNSPLAECYALPAFDTGPRPGTFDSCGLRNRFDYIFISQSLTGHFASGGLFRRGLWGTRQTRPTDWETYPQMLANYQQASDHAAVYVDRNL